MGRVGFSSYATERLTGFDGEPRPMQPQVERTLFPEFYAEMAVEPTRPAVPGVQRTDYLARPRVHPARHRHLEGRAAGRRRRPRSSCRPSRRARSGSTSTNEYYPSDEAFVFAAAEALANEYRAIVDAGFILQLDDPGLAMGWNRAEFADAHARRLPRGSSPNTSRRSISRSTASPPIGSACTCAGATTSRRTCATCRWRRSSTCCSGSTRRACTSRAPIRAMATNGASSKSTRLPDGKVLIPGVYRLGDQLRRAPGSGRRAHRALRERSLAKRTSSPAPTAASAPSPAPSRASTPRSRGPNSRPSSTAPSGRASGCGDHPRQNRLTASSATCEASPAASMSNAWRPYGTSRYCRGTPRRSSLCASWRLWSDGTASSLAP